MVLLVRLSLGAIYVFVLIELWCLLIDDWHYMETMLFYSPRGQ